MPDEVIVQETASNTQPEGTVSTETTTPPNPEVAAALAEAKAIRAELAQLVEDSKRQIQSAKDRARAEVESAQKRARIAESTYTATRQELGNLDPDSMTKLELARYKAAEQARIQAEQEEGVRLQQEAFHTQFNSSLMELITDMGLDPKDKRIDWATDAANYLDAQKRVLKSAVKIQKENIKTLEASIPQKLKEAEAKLRKDLGLDSVDTTTSVGVAGSSDAKFLKDFGAGDLPMTKANFERYKKIQATS